MQVCRTCRIAAHSALEQYGYNHFVPMGKPKLMVTGISGNPTKWNFVTGKLYVPKDYEGLRIEYNGDSFVDYVNVSEQFEISYY